MHVVWIWLPQASEVCALLRVVVFSNVCDVCLYSYGYEACWLVTFHLLILSFHLSTRPQVHTKERATQRPEPRKGLSQADP